MRPLLWFLVECSLVRLLLRPRVWRRVRGSAASCICRGGPLKNDAERGLLENPAGLRALLSGEINIPSHQASLLGLPDLPLVAPPAGEGSGFGPSHPVEGVVPGEVARALGSDVVRASIRVSVQTNTTEDRVSRSYTKMIARYRLTHPLYLFL